MGVRKIGRAAIGVLEKMLGIAGRRLLKTGSFLSQMVQWGDDARKRAVTDSATGVPSGRGLGLAFCRMVLELHGGSIWVEDNQPTGSVFTLELPPVTQEF